MDEPASALDPISTSRIEDLIHDLKQQYTIVIVTHNMQQAARVADMTAFFSVEVREDGTGRHGILVEYAQTTKIFTNPSDKRTEDYVTGRFGIMARLEYQAGLDALEASLQEQGQVVLAGPSAAPSTPSQAQDVELCDEVIAFDDEIDVRYHPHRAVRSGDPRPAGARRDRPPARARRPPHTRSTSSASATRASRSRSSRSSPADLETRHDLHRGARRDGRPLRSTWCASRSTPSRRATSSGHRSSSISTS